MHAVDKFLQAKLSYFMYVTGFGKTGVIAGLVKIDFFFPEKASTKFKYCLRKI